MTKVSELISESEAEAPVVEAMARAMAVADGVDPDEEIFDSDLISCAAADGIAVSRAWHCRIPSARRQYRAYRAMQFALQA